MGGAAPVVDAQGHIWVATGNGSVTSASGPYDDSDAVLELSAHLGLVQHFAPSHWYGDNASDLDLGSAAPALLPSGLVVQAGKSNNAYLLRASHLGGVGGQIATLRGICGGDVAGGAAFGPSVAYLPCESGLIKVVTDSATGSMHERWKSPTGAGGPPILAGGLVWTISNGTLYGLSPDTGKATQQLAIGQAATSFPTPSVGDGLLLAPSANQVHAFRPS
jgi:outer membrane protein assembly factor BamB